MGRVTLGIVLATLAADPPGTDLYGDPLPKGAVARLGTVRFRTAPSWLLRFTNDPDRLVGLRDNRVCLLDATTGREVRRLVSPPFEVHHFTLSPDERRILLIDWDAGNRARLWDLDGGKE